MLKIQRSAHGAFVVFALSGRIQGTDVAELQRLLDLEANTQTLRLDLHEVKLVDREAVRFLARCEAAGITLVHCPAYIRAWIGQEKGQP
jgi:STAS domain